jgi:hypothetical protein
MVLALFLAIGLASNVAASTHAKEFLKSSPDEYDDYISQADIRAGLLSQVEGALGSGSASNRLSQMKETLAPIFAALPKNKHGNLEHNTVRHALHRLFVLRHGWVIKGLRLHDSWNFSSPAGILKNQVPAYIEDLFEKRLQDKSFRLHELAVFAATLEHLIHNEAVAKLGDVYTVHQVLPTDVLSEEQADEVLDTYMMAYILGESFVNMTLTYARNMNVQMNDMFVAWKDTQKFVRGLRSNLTHGELDFAALSRVVSAIGERYGTFQDRECGQLKATLMKMGHHTTGRVELADFYKPALGGDWQFQESIGYLRQLGAIDEADPKHPSVIIANYLATQTNCIAPSGFYTVCCKGECEGLLGSLEKKLATPEAKPYIIADLVAQLPSSTVKAPRNLSATLLRRLDDIGSSHGGVVPIHGRLFAQWLHNAFPLECPFPHLSGTISSQSGEEWEANNAGQYSSASRAEMNQYVSKPREDQHQEVADIDGGVAPWSFEEELLVAHDTSRAPLSAALRSVILVIASCSFALALLRSFKMPLMTNDASALKMV